MEFPADYMLAILEILKILHKMVEVIKQFLPESPIAENSWIFVETTAENGKVIGRK